MAFTRKMLKAMSIDDEKIDQIIEAHLETLNSIKDERDSYKEDAEKMADLQKELKELKDNAKDESKNPWKAKFDELKDEYEQYKQDEAVKETKRTKENAYKQLLKECNVSDKRISSVLRVSDLESIELGEDGKIINADELKKSIKKEWSDFIYSESEKGAETATPPTNTGGKKSKEEIMAIKDSVERQNAIAENLDLFQ